VQQAGRPDLAELAEWLFETAVHDPDLYLAATPPQWTSQQVADALRIMHPTHPRVCSLVREAT